MICLRLVCRVLRLIFVGIFVVIDVLNRWLLVIVVLCVLVVSFLMLSVCVFSMFEILCMMLGWLFLSIWIFSS